MATLDKKKTIVLSKALTMGDVRYEHLDLKEPVLAEVEQFYDIQRAKNSMAAMKLLIALNTGVTEKALGSMAFTDYRQCEDYLMSFLTFDPSPDGSS
ncbi:phage tail assembly protein [Serratia symbiotica]|uniref:Phage tail assembly protein n=1 Tax=Serratia symbiotica TaxID=138074 RepID=A0A7D5SG99_9GAMM|nr:phage tail assembly protein [Serratia symbiotica]MBQ0955990.1 phage tail assembly protein [Serratia symbiotica]MBQ0956927.1 phage tail assembly protein [Serratia symbiotica]QLH63172.1 phage tail assembly protein [Serratia symbiotica]